MSIDIAKRRILERVSLKDLLSEKISFQNRAGRPVGLCPFHNEKSGSFTLYDDHYYCFGCQARGDAIEYIKQTEGLGFIDSLKFLAQKYSIDAPELEESQKHKFQKNHEAQLYKLLKDAHNFFIENLKANSGRSATSYLEGRGYSKEAIGTYAFGLSPDQPQALIQYLLKKGYQIKDMIEASIATQSQRDNRAYDFFRNRLIIPIYDKYGRVIAFGGRTMGNDPAKYKNSRETPLFDRSLVLYGFQGARTVMRKKGRAIVAEGYMDVLQLWNFGFTESVACLGTALTLPQLRQISNSTSTVYLLFDGDKAGEGATLRTVTHALEVPNLQVKVVRLPEKEDPDTFLRENGPEALEKLLDEATDLFDFAINNKLSNAHGLAVPELVKKEISPWLRSIRDPLKRSYLISQTTKLTGIEAAVINSFIQQKPEEPKRQAAEPVKEEPKVKPLLTRPLTAVEYELLAHIFFAKPGEIDIERTSSLMSELQIDELWLIFASEALSYLKRDISPHDLEIADWKAGTYEQIIKLLASFESKKSAFEHDNRKKAIEILARKIRFISLKNTLSMLKKNLISSPPEGQKDILVAISQINRDLVSLEKES